MISFSPLAFSYITRRRHKALGFKARSQNFGKQLLASSCLSVCPCVRMEQLGSHRTDFHEI